MKREQVRRLFHVQITQTHNIIISNYYDQLSNYAIISPLSIKTRPFHTILVLLVNDLPQYPRLMVAVFGSIGAATATSKVVDR